MKIFNLKNYSLITKVLILFFIITFFSIFLRTALAQPKIEEKNIKDDVTHITKALLVAKDLVNESTLEIELKEILEKNLALKSSKVEFFNSNIDKNFFTSEEKIDNKTFIVWCFKLNFKNEKNRFLKFSLDKKELEEKNKTSFLVKFLLPETLIALAIGIFLILILVRKMLKDIEILNKQLTKSLEEKDILLKEIHHRVKNNLALTISLIELQEEEIDDVKAKKVLFNIQERLYTMELLHRKLYESTNLSEISLKNYINDLVQTISKTHNSYEKIDLEMKVEDINLSIETAMPYGLILNELLTNAFKYAFINQKNPKLEIYILKNNNEEIELIVKDNGKGLQKEFSKISNETLGLRLINMIVKFQLMGTITYSYENGAKFLIKSNFKK